MKTVIKKLDEMTAQEWCRLVEERIKVFVVEQDCAYQEVDQDDYHAAHLMLFDDADQLVGYTRIYRRSDGKVTFGRVLVPMQYRKNHYGRQLVEQTIKATHRLFPESRHFDMPRKRLQVLPKTKMLRSLPAVCAIRISPPQIQAVPSLLRYKAARTESV